MVYSILVKKRYEKLLEESKLMLSEYKDKYPDDTKNIKRLNDSIVNIETKYKGMFIVSPNWDKIQQRYEEYCDTFSPAYLAGSEWYKYIGKDFKKGYFKALCIKQV